MKHKYSLVHLTNIACPPPEFIRMAAAAGFDAVSLRTIPLGLPGEKPYDLAHDAALRKETERALRETGISYTDTEIARIADGVDVRDHEAALACAAEMGVRHVTTNIWTDDREKYTEQFALLCEIAGKYGIDVNIEFVTWASVGTFEQAKELILATGVKNGGIVVDTIHFYRSKVQLTELDSCPKEWFKYAHLCDAGKEIPTDLTVLARDARSERLYPGEGSIPIREIIERIPNKDITYGVELPHDRRLAELGFEEYARRVLKSAKTCMGEAD